MAIRFRWAWGLLAGCALLGCNGVPEETPGTGAKECAQAYCDALIRKDWPRAYALLDLQSQKRCSSQQFTRLALSYRDHVGFEPETVQVQACEERAAEATAHLVLTGHTSGHHRRYKDAVTLRRTDNWHVILPSNFGQTKKR